MHMFQYMDIVWKEDAEISNHYWGLLRALGHEKKAALYSNDSVHERTLQLGTCNNYLRL